MKKEWRWLRWKCPHCDVGMMALNSAERHLKRRHWDCWSCKCERMLVQELMRDSANCWISEYHPQLSDSRA